MHDSCDNEDMPSRRVVSQAASHFDMFRIAWRNYTMHSVEAKYTEEEADIISGT